MQSAKHVATSAMAKRKRIERWHAPIKPDTTLQLQIEELTHTTGFTFAELERMEVDEDWAEFVDIQDGKFHA